jgi:hypothetical protein
MIGQDNPMIVGRRWKIGSKPAHNRQPRIGSAKQ